MKRMWRLRADGKLATGVRLPEALPMTKYQCGCTIARANKKDEPIIVYCSLHRSAAMMFEKWGEILSYEQPTSYAALLGREVFRAVTGKAYE